MRFLVDAQLPARLCDVLNSAGHDALRTRELPHGNRTSDLEIASTADRDGRVAVTKGRDFRASNLLNGSPRHLLLVTTGNIANTALIAVFTRDMATIVAMLEQASVVEIAAGRIVAHADRESG